MCAIHAILKQKNKIQTIWFTILSQGVCGFNLNVCVSLFLKKRVNDLFTGLVSDRASCWIWVVRLGYQSRDDFFLCLCFCFFFNDKQKSKSTHFSNLIFYMRYFAWINTVVIDEKTKLKLWNIKFYECCILFCVASVCTRFRGCMIFAWVWILFS